MSRPFPVFLYHSVTDTPTSGMERFTLHPDRFAEHLDRLIDNDCIVMTMGEVAVHLRSGVPLPERAVSVTFDDGLADFARHAWPALRARTMRATLYPVVGYVGDRSRWLTGPAADLRMLTATELSSLAADGVEMGSHGMTHPQLDLLSTAGALREIVESKDLLEQMLGRPVTTFAYPHGHHSGIVKELVAGAGYTSAAAVRNMFSHDRDDVFAVARLTVTNSMTTGEVGRLLRGQGARLAPRRELLRTKAGRQLRRFRSSPEPVRWA